VRDVGAFATRRASGGAPIQGVRLAGLFQHVRLHPEAILVNVLSRNGFQATLWTNEILPLAIVAYARDGDVLPRELGGPYRLIVPVCTTKPATCGIWP
jgi:DMSO/TMAO reductase YedYZ molybdopterin-dependent catalytic subunit